MDEEHLAKMIEANKEFIINSACDFADEVRECDYDVGFISIRTLTTLLYSTDQVRNAQRRAREKHVYFDPEDNGYGSTWDKVYEEDGS